MIIEFTLLDNRKISIISDKIVSFNKLKETEGTEIHLLNNYINIINVKENYSEVKNLINNI